MSLCRWCPQCSCKSAWGSCECFPLGACGDLSHVFPHTVYGSFPHLSLCRTCPQCSCKSAWGSCECFPLGACGTGSPSCLHSKDHWSVHGHQDWLNACGNHQHSLHDEHQQLQTLL